MHDPQLITKMQRGNSGKQDVKFAFFKKKLRNIFFLNFCFYYIVHTLGNVLLMH